MNRYDFDVVVIGGGPAGLVAAKVAKGFKKKVALVEKSTRLGGECTWTGCVPSKTLTHCAQWAAHAKLLQPYQIHASESPLNSRRIMELVRNNREKIYQTHTPEKLEKAGIRVIFGNPVFRTNHEVELNGSLVSSKNFILCTGSRPIVPPLEGLNTLTYLTNETLFDLDQLPSSLIILGAGPVGIEIAQAYNHLGVTVTVIEARERILSREDAELSAFIQQRLVTQGVRVNLGLQAIKAVGNADGITVTCVNTEGKSCIFEAEKILIAVGRQPMTEDLNLGNAGVQVDKHGIVVNSTLRTTASNIYACGDVVGPYQFSHMAEYQAIIAARNACVPFFKAHVDYTNVTWVTFTDPELASAGLTEAEARARYGQDIKVYRKLFADLDRAQIDLKPEGLAKFICDAGGRLLGVHIAGARAGELIHEIQIGKYNRLKLSDFYFPIHAYPTYSEIIWQAARDAYVKELESNFFLRILRSLIGW